MSSLGLISSGLIKKKKEEEITVNTEVTKHTASKGSTVATARCSTAVIGAPR
jgi:hypothetical protein